MSSKFLIYWQNPQSQWRYYTSKNNQMDAYREMKRRVQSTGLRHRIEDEDGHLIDIDG